MIDLSDFLIPYPLIVAICVAVIVTTLMVLRRIERQSRGKWWLMVTAWSWLGLSYLFGWRGWINEVSRISMLRAGLFLLALAIILHLLDYLKVFKVIRGNKSKSA